MAKGDNYYNNILIDKNIDKYMLFSHMLFYLLKVLMWHYVSFTFESLFIMAKCDPILDILPGFDR